MNVTKVRPEKKPTQYFNEKAFVAAYFFYPRSGVKLNASDWLVLLCLAKNINRSTNDAFLSTDKIAAEIRLGKNTVSRSIRRLSSKGLIRAGTGFGESNLYTLLFLRNQNKLRGN